jgi:hypothetical protein
MPSKLPARDSGAWFAVSKDGVGIPTSFDLTMHMNEPFFAKELKVDTGIQWKQGSVVRSWRRELAQSTFSKDPELLPSAATWRIPAKTVGR